MNEHLLSFLSRVAYWVISGKQSDRPAKVAGFYSFSYCGKFVLLCTNYKVLLLRNCVLLVYQCRCRLKMLDASTSDGGIPPIVVSYPSDGGI